MAWQWIAASLLTGQVIADLPSFDPDWPLRRTVSKVDTASGTLHLEGAPENWPDAVYEGGSLLACFDDADSTQAVVWCGYVPAAGPFDAGSDALPVQLATFEAILDRCPVGDVTYTTSQHRDDIIADLVTTWLEPGMGIGYLQLAYTVGNGPTPVLMDSPPTPNAAIIMQNADNASLLTRITQVVGQLGGEFTVEWALTSSGGNQFLVPTLRFGDRIGQAAVAGLAPIATFEMPGSLIGLSQMRDYSAGAGANKVVPYSSGQGSSTPFGTPVFGPADGRPTFEERYEPAPSLSPAALSQYAQQAIKIRAPGKRPVTLTASTSGRVTGRQVGVDWGLGDDIGYSVPAQYTDETGETVSVLAFPQGLSGVGRVIAYELGDTTVSPILADAEVYSQGAG